MRINLKSKTTRVTIAVAAVLSLMSGTALATVSIVRPENHSPEHVTFSGKGVVAMKTVVDNGFQQFTGTAWQSLTGSSNYVSVPSGTTRVAQVTFSAESYCVGTSGGCRVRIVGRKSGTMDLVEFYPRQPLSYFDTATSSTDLWENHSFTRTKTLTAGTWQIFVQATTQNASGTTFQLTGWSHSVDLYAR